MNARGRDARHRDLFAFGRLAWADGVTSTGAIDTTTTDANDKSELSGRANGTSADGPSRTSMSIASIIDTEPEPKVRMPMDLGSDDGNPRYERHEANIPKSARIHHSHERQERQQHTEPNSFVSSPYPPWTHATARAGDVSPSATSSSARQSWW